MDAQPTLIGERVRLRPPVPGDVGALVAACNDPDIAHFTRVAAPYTEADAHDFLDGAARSWTEQRSVVFVIADDSDELLGTCGLMFEPEHGQLGYVVAPWARGRGVARDAIATVTRWAHTERGYPLVRAMIEDANAASIGAIEASGFVQAGEAFTLELKGSVRTLHHYEHRA